MRIPSGLHAPCRYIRIREPAQLGSCEELLGVSASNYSTPPGACYCPDCLVQRLDLKRHECKDAAECDAGDRSCEGHCQVVDKAKAKLQLVDSEAHPARKVGDAG